MWPYRINSKSERIDAVIRKIFDSYVSVRCGDNECYVLRTIDSYTQKKKNQYQLPGYWKSVRRQPFHVPFFPPFLFFPWPTSDCSVVLVITPKLIEKLFFSPLLSVIAD